MNRIPMTPVTHRNEMIRTLANGTQMISTDSKTKEFSKPCHWEKPDSTFITEIMR